MNHEHSPQSLKKIGDVMTAFNANSRNTIYSAMKDGLKSVKVGRLLRFRDKDIQEYIESKIRES